MNKFIDFEAAVAAWQINKNESAIMYDNDSQIWIVGSTDEIENPIEQTRAALKSGGLSESKISELMSGYVPVYPKKELSLIISNDKYTLFGDFNGFFQREFYSEPEMHEYCSKHNVIIKKTYDHRGE